MRCELFHDWSRKEPDIDGDGARRPSVRPARGRSAKGIEVRYRAYSETGLEVSELGFGCSRIGGMFAKGNGDDPVTVLRNAADSGITFFDTADIYSQGESESLIGRAFQGRRDQVVIATKGGYVLPTQRKFLAKVKPVLRPVLRVLPIKRENLSTRVVGTLSQEFSGRYLASALEESLRRLRTDYVDIYQLHSPPASVIQQSDWHETLENLRHQGKVRAFGIAADSVADAHSALARPGLTSLQFPFGLLDLEGLENVLAGPRQPAGIITRGCFGGGLLKETLTEAELRSRTAKTPRIMEFRQVAARCGRSILELAMQFSLFAPNTDVVLVGMSSDLQLRENLRHYGAPPLTRAEFDAIVDTATREAQSGDRPIR